MKILFRTVLFVLLFVVKSTFAAKVDTVETFSSSMNKKIKAVVITPESYGAGKEFPVVYLLHGAGGDYSNWVKKVPAIRDYADQYNQIIVCPDGNLTSWYFNSPEDKESKYETYIADELVKWIDKNYKSIKNRTGRAITGLSMGGHGGLYLAFKHQDIFGAAGSMSGGVDLRPFPNNWGLAKHLGTYAAFPERWEQNSVINMLHLLTPKSLAMIIDCGTEDFFFKVNENLHQKLSERNIPHDYITRPGAHNWNYWANAVNYQLLYMNKFFTAKPLVN
ncbi:MAG TPA: alpha/beta hydrolase family protein [Sphingobacteriaceae bacterium]|nr:alpha/beta hydrolase family protein [Sphingobacteriaceae bacterium]